jgi:glutathione S-transferase
MKVEVYFKVAGVPYRAVESNPQKAPKKKLPYVILEDGGVIADSESIVAHFEATVAEPVDAGLDEEERAHAHVIRRTIEEGLYFAALWSRWATDAGWAAMLPVFAPIPAPVRWIVAPLVRKQIVGQAHAQGTGRHSPDEIYALARKDLRAVMTLLDGKPFLLGDAPRIVDITAYAFFANLVVPDIDTPLREIGKTTPGLVDYIERMSDYVSKKVASRRS